MSGVGLSPRTPRTPRAALSGEASSSTPAKRLPVERMTGVDGFIEGRTGEPTVGEEAPTGEPAARLR